MICSTLASSGLPVGPRPWSAQLGPAGRYHASSQRITTVPVLPASKVP